MLLKIELELKFTEMVPEEQSGRFGPSQLAAAELMKVIFISKIVHFECLIWDNVDDVRSLIYCSLVLRMHTLKSLQPPLIACCYFARSFIT